MMNPNMFILLSKTRMVSPTGQCHAFSDKADGYTRGEGCGVVILKRLEDVSIDCCLFICIIISGNFMKRTRSNVS